jgi:acetylornithine deacetylase/succinyl-diaminopimelate desuccinylase-like protein
MNSSSPTNYTNLIKELTPKYENFLSELVECYSPKGSEAEVQSLIKSKMEQIGLEVTCAPKKTAENLCGIIRGGDRKIARSLVLGAHCDVAPVDEPTRWKFSPFKATVVGRTMYGRGVLDDKAGIAIILMVAEIFLKSKRIPRGDLLIQSVSGEETSGYGTQSLVNKDFSADGVIICDGTWPLRIIRGNLGQIFLDVNIVGNPVAACVEYRVENPLVLAAEFILRFKEEINQLAEKHPPPKNLSKTFFCNVGSLKSGEWHGSVPGSAKIELQVGFWIGSSELIFNLAKKIALKMSNQITISKGSLDVMPFSTSEDNQLIDILKSTIFEKLGSEPETLLVTGHCDLQYYKTENVCLYGPGGGYSPHGIDECYNLDDMSIVASNLLDVTNKWCNMSKSSLIKT